LTHACFALFAMNILQQQNGCKINDIFLCGKDDTDALFDHLVLLYQFIVFTLLNMNLVDVGEMVKIWIVSGFESPKDAIDLLPFIQWRCQKLFR
jgi:hypothetical protein